jgi:hypothetical protein
MVELTSEATEMSGRLYSPLVAEVIDGCQRQGIGSALLRLLARAPQNGIESMVSRASSGAIYEKSNPPIEGLIRGLGTWT